MKKILLYLQSVFYIAAGCNHFRKPVSYETIIPFYIPEHAMAVVLSGMAEIILGVMLLFTATRKTAVYGLVLMLLIFLPVHVYFVQVNSCLPTFCFPAWTGWVRLLVIHPLLMAWAWWYKEYKLDVRS